MATADERIDHLLALADYWAEMSELAGAPPPGLAERAQERLARTRGQRGQRLVALLRGLGTSALPRLLVALDRPDDVAVDALRALSVPATPLTYERLVPLLQSEHERVVSAAIGAASFVRDDRMAAGVFKLWHSQYRLDVALCLGRMRATQYTEQLVKLLQGKIESLSGPKWHHVSVALESMADAACVPAVRDLLRTAPESQVWALCAILRAASKRDRLADWRAPDGSWDIEVLRTAWLSGRVETTGLCEFQALERHRIEFLWRGTGRIRLGYPPALSVGNWARWNRALYFDDDILYHLNSDCPTCETFMRRAECTPARTHATRVSDALDNLGGDVALTEDSLAEFAPLLTPLPSGRYYAIVADILLERVDRTRAGDSWYFRRSEYRVSNDPDWAETESGDGWFSDLEPEHEWPGTDHYQARSRLSDQPPTYLTVMPTQPIDRFDEATIDARRAALARGHRRAALGLAWYEHRDLVGEYPEAMLQVVILDGHHTVEACTRAQQPTRFLLICPWTFSWPPSLRAALDALNAPPDAEPAG